MPKYVLLYTAPISAEEQMQMSEEEGKAEMEVWMAWSGRLGPALLDFGLPLGNGRAVTSSGATPTTSEVNGYSIIEADDIDAAVALTESHPHLRRGTIEVLETMPIPGM